MKSFIIYSIRSVSYLVIGTLLLASFIFAFLQTPYAQKKLIAFIEKTAAENDLKIKIDQLRGRPPLTWHISHLKIDKKNLIEANLENLSIHIGLLPLFKGKVVINSLNADKAVLNFEPLSFDAKNKQGTAFDSINIQNTLNSFKSICIHNLTLKKNEKNLSTFYFCANAKSKRKSKELYFKLLNEETRSALEIYANYAPVKCILEAKGIVDLKNSKILEPVMSIAYPIALQAEFDLNGPINLLEKNPVFLLNGKMKSECSFLDIPKAPYLEKPWKVTTDFVFSSDKIAIDNTRIESEILSADLSASYHFKNAFSYDVKVALPNLKKIVGDLAFEGPFKVFLKGDEHTASATLSSDALSFNDQELSPLYIEAQLDKKENLWEAIIEGGSSQSSFPLKIFSKFNTQAFNQFCIETFVINTDAAQFSSQGILSLNPFALNGCTHLNIYKLSSFSDLLKGAAVEGKLGLSCCFKSEKEEEIAKLQVHGEGIRYNDIYVSGLNLQADIAQFASHPTGLIALNITNLSSSSYYIDALKVESSSSTGTTWPFIVSSQGNWETPFILNSEGALHFDPHLFWCELKKLEGLALKQNFKLQDPTTFSYTEEAKKLSPLVITTTHGEVNLDFEQNLSIATINAEFKHIPLEFLAITHPDFSLKGISSLSLHMKGENNDLKGNAKLTIEEVDIEQTSKNLTKQAKGFIELHLADDKLQAFAEIDADDSQKMSLQSTLPYQFRNNPLSFKLDDNQKIFASLELNGKIEELFDFINLGANRITGLVQANLLLSNTLENPLLHGNLKLDQGTYESYFLGTHLENISLNLQASKNIAYIKDLKAFDKKGGYAEANGYVELSKKKLFPFDFSFTLHDLEYLDLDTLTASFSGPLTLKGSGDGLQIDCKVEIPAASYIIAETQEPPLSSLDVEYVNQPKKVQRAFSSIPSLPFKIDLNAHANAPSKVFVRGKGLTSEWGGELFVKTVKNNDLELEGKLNLIKGEYLFSGKRFNLQEGEIMFNPKAGPYINLKGVAEIGGYAINMQVRGPVSEPSLTFTSSPYLPTSSILSYILFNKDISEISPFQAIQLAQTLVSLSSGSGPDILDKIRTSLGVDRFGIVSDSRGGDQVSLQIGKYLTQGVLVTLSQSTTSSDVIVEVDLKHGFAFQAETQDQQEGKFSLKWHHNY